MDYQGWICSLCSSSAASQYCICEQEPVRLCGDCLGQHTAKERTRIHSMHSIDTYPYRLIPGYFSRLDARSQRMESACERLADTLKINLEQIDRCETKFQTIVRSVAKSLKEHMDSETAKLRAFKTQMQMDVEESEKEARERIFEDAPELKSKYAALLRGEAEGPSLQCFAYNLQSADPIEFVSLVWGQGVERLKNRRSWNELSEENERLQAQIASQSALFSQEREGLIAKGRERISRLLTERSQCQLEIERLKSELAGIRDEPLNEKFSKSLRATSARVVERQLEEERAASLRPGREDSLKRLQDEKLAMKLQFEAKIEQLSQEKETQRKDAAAEMKRMLDALAELRLNNTPDTILPVILGNSLCCFSLIDQSARILPFPFSEFTMFCVMDAECVLCVGGKPANASAYVLGLTFCTVIQVQSMKVARYWPGLIKYDKFVYLFGGFCGSSAMKSCEKFWIGENRWTSLPYMEYERGGFSPCELQKVVYLLDVLQACKRVEAFSVAIEEFRVLGVEIPTTIQGCSVAFAVGDEIVVLSSSGQMGRWRPGFESCFRTAPVKLSDRDSVISNIPPMRVRRDVLWVRWNDKALIRFNIDSSQLFE